MTLYLIRHGETYFNIDPTKSKELTNKGKKQAKEIIKKLKNQKFDAIYSSTMSRAKDTAKEIIKFHPKTQYFEREEFKEISGKLIGRQESVSLKKYICNKLRMQKALKILRKNSDKKILVICHENVILYILTKFLKIANKKGNMFRVNNCQIVKIEKNKIEFI